MHAGVYNIHSAFSDELNSQHVQCGRDLLKDIAAARRVCALA